MKILEIIKQLQDDKIKNLKKTVAILAAENKELKETLNYIRINEEEILKNNYEEEKEKEYMRGKISAYEYTLNYRG